MIGRAGSCGAIAQPLLLSEVEGMRRIVADIKFKLASNLIRLTSVLPFLN